VLARGLENWAMDEVRFKKNPAAPPKQKNTAAKIQGE
jgi:hypothetical protein